MKYKIGIIGTGFVGTACSVGFETLLEHKVQIREYDKFKNTESLDSVVNNSDILFVGLPTPMDSSTGACDVSIVRSVIKEIDEIAESSKTIVIKSTVPPGTTSSLQKLYPKHTFLFNPEFLTEKNFINDFLEQDRIILGTPNNFKKNSQVLKVINLYQDFTKSQKKPATILDTTIEVAEMLKYTTNCYLAVKVSYFNEIKEICNAAKIKYEDLIGLLTYDKRVGKTHMQVPGPDGKHGFGGSCFVKDLNSLIYFAKQLGVDPLVMESVWSKNLLIREDYEWEKLAQVTGKYKKNE